MDGQKAKNRDKVDRIVPLFEGRQWAGLTGSPTLSRQVPVFHRKHGDLMICEPTRKAAMLAVGVHTTN
jgi:hypothetical protein